MQIGAVAKRIGLSFDAIRFYERNALLPRPLRTEGGFRKYGENDVETPSAASVIVYKHRFSGFYQTELHSPFWVHSQA